MLKKDSYFNKVINPVVSESPKIITTNIAGRKLQDILDCERFENCFFSERECAIIHSYGLKDKHFNNCIFIIPKIYPAFFNLLIYNTVTNSVFCAEDSTLTFNSSELYLKFFNNETYNNIIIKNSFTHELREHFGHNWSNIPRHITYGMRLYQENLTDIILPADKDFFNNLYSNMIYKCQLPIIDFNKYSFTENKLPLLRDTNDTNNFEGITSSVFSFEHIYFPPETIFSKDMLKSRMLFCTFNNADLSHITPSKAKYHFYHCSFIGNTIFPNYPNLFEDNFFFMCSLPKYDFTPYIINTAIDNNCIFTLDSILPNYLFNTDNINMLEKMNQIPTAYLWDVILSSTITDKERFFSKYADKLSPLEKYLFFNIYS